MIIVNNRTEMNLKGFPRSKTGQVFLCSIQPLANQILAADTAKIAKLGIARIATLDKAMIVKLRIAWIAKLVIFQISTEPEKKSIDPDQIDKIC
jgi:hypothetical protein